MSALDLSIVIPLYNERENVRPLHAALTEALTPLGKSYEIIMVNDGSQDGSLEELRAIQDPNLKVISFRRNFGQTAGFAAGFDHAQGEVIITLDADLQNDPQDIPRLLDEMAATGADIVSGRRMDRKEPFLSRKLPSQLANWLIGRATGVELHDYGCSLKAYRRDVIQRVRLYGEMHRYIPAIANMVGAKAVEIPVKDHPRIHGKSKYGLSRVVRVIPDLIAVYFLLRYRDRPMQFFGRIGLAAFGLGILAELVWLLALILGGGSSASWGLVLGILLNGLGVHFLCLGLLGEMLMRIYYESQDKPVYVIRETMGFGQGND